MFLVAGWFDDPIGWNSPSQPGLMPWGLTRKGFHNSPVLTTLSSFPSWKGLLRRGGPHRFRRPTQFYFLLQSNVAHSGSTEQIFEGEKEKEKETTATASSEYSSKWTDTTERSWTCALSCGITSASNYWSLSFGAASLLFEAQQDTRAAAWSAWRRRGNDISDSSASENILRSISLNHCGAPVTGASRKIEQNCRKRCRKC